MSESTIEPYAVCQEDESLRQGEILSNLSEVRATGGLSGSESKPSAVIVGHPYALVMTQECDLSWDHEARTGENAPEHKRLPNVLFCELQLADQLRAAQPDKGAWKRIAENRTERYFLLREVPPRIGARHELTENLVADFKRLFTVGSDLLYQQLGKDVGRVCRLQGPFMQHVANRFGYYQSRVALPGQNN